MKIMFLNAWNRNTDAVLRDYLTEQAKTTDIFCFQEAPDRMKAHYPALSDYEELYDHKFVTEIDDYPQTILVKHGIEIVSSGSLFKDDDTVGLALYMELRVGAAHLWVCNVHGSARPDDKRDSPDRLKHSKALIEFFKDKKDPVIIGGDFNIHNDTDSIRMFSENGYRDLVDEFKIETTRNILAWERFAVPMYYSDYVFLNDQVTLKNFTVVDNRVSDHLPLIVEIDI